VASTLKQNIRDHVLDPAVAGLVIETELSPLGGIATPVSPPTYAAESGRSGPQYAHSPSTFVPKRGSGGWFNEIERDADGGVPRLADSVVLDSFASQSGRAETKTWTEQERLGVELPGLVISGPTSEMNDADRTPADGTSPEAQAGAAFAKRISTWEAAHRQADGWFRFGSIDGAKQVWDVKNPDQSIKSIIMNASAENADLLYRYFPNSAIYGFWLSSGTAARHRLPRAYSSQIVGYGARAVTAGATKLDPTGGASKDVKIAIEAGRLTLKGGKRTGGSDKDGPSAAGLGQVPSAPVTRGFVCELILQQSTLSLPVLRSLAFETAERREAALTVLVLLAMVGHYLNREDGFLRSGCALVARHERWGWQRHRSTEPEDLELSGWDELAEALREAVADAEAVGLEFASPVELVYSPEQIELIKGRVANEAASAASEDA